MNFGELLRHMREQNDSLGIAKEARVDVAFTKLFMEVFSIDKREEVNYINLNGISNNGTLTGVGYEVVFKDASRWLHEFYRDGELVAQGEADIKTLKGAFTTYAYGRIATVLETRFMSIQVSPHSADFFYA